MDRYVIIVIIFYPTGSWIPAFYFIFFKLAHRGHGYLLLIFFSPLAHRGLGYLLCTPSLPNLLAHRGNGYLPLFFLFFCPSGPWIPALIFFFPCPSGPRIPALIFFSLPIGAADTCLDFCFIPPIGALYGWKSVGFCGSLYYLECLQNFAANRLCCVSGPTALVGR